MGIQTALDSINQNSGSPFGFKNRIINGGMAIDQRNNGSSITPSNGDVYNVDRFVTYNSAASKYTVQRNAGSVAPPPGFTNYLGITSTSAYSVGSGELFILYQCVEGFNWADLDYGKTTAKYSTLSFWVRSSLTGTFGGSFLNSAQDRGYAFSYTINSANTWEYKTITVPGDTTGTWLSDNNRGLILSWSLGSGSNFAYNANSWRGNQVFTAIGSTSVLGTNGATFYITGVQLEVGKQATNFDYRSYGTELALCQRYFWRVYGQNIDIAMNNQTAPYSSVTFSTLNNPVTMRASGTFAHNMTNAKNTTSTPGADQWAWYIQNQGYGSTSSGDIANLNGGGQLYCRIGAYTLAPTAASTGIRMGANIYIENSAEI